MVSGIDYSDRDREEKMNGRQGKCILVGLQIDGNEQEPLDWALTKAANAGDRVLAVHVCRDPSDSTLSLIKVIDDYLGAYEGLCGMKRVVLVGKVSKGSSIRRVLVREAKSNTAKIVVVGANKTCKFGPSTSVAKYCAKKLPPTTSLFAIQNGKVILERLAAKAPQGGEPKPNLGSLLHPSVGMAPKVIVPSSRGENGEEKKKPLPDATAKDLSLVCVRRSSESRLGWPLLHKAVCADFDSCRDAEARKMSVVQWVMRLPNRRPSPSVGPPKYGENLHGLVSIHQINKDLDVVLGINPSNCKWFGYEELQSSTNNFSSDNLIGKGGNSSVYKGCLTNGQQIAIKLCKLSAESSKNFITEIGIITSLQHYRIVPLIGVCVDENSLISVYNYFSKGSLEENLHGKRAKTPIPWNIRYKVAIGAAEALSYLHDDCSRPVIHRDVKSSNILLSDEFEPQLSDFGLAVWAPEASRCFTFSDVVGTFGYLAPEYFMYGKVSDKIDVYAFGIVLLELLTGRKPINDENPKGQESLVMWAKPMLERGDEMKLLDPNLDAKHERDQIRRLILAASLCINRNARLRPPINQILSLLRGEEKIEQRIFAAANDSSDDLECQDDEEAYPISSFGSHVGVALHDVVDDDASIASYEQNNMNSWEDYLKGRWSRTSSFE